jgi:2-hydroxy-3-keto-5-methylthiopentenyl-1-phosphate phosphatase
VRKTVIFCDFDGTITINDNIVAIMKHFQPPGWDKWVERIVSRKISIKEGVGNLFSLLPSSRRDEIVDYAVNACQIRPGFAEFLDYCRRHSIEFFVTSGGIDFFVYPALAPYAIDPDHIYCNAGNFEDERVRIEWPNPCDEHCSNNCGMCKTTIIRRFPSNRYNRILIGDSVTDFEGAKLAELVFARSHLVGLCEQLSLPYYPFETFFDIIAKLEETAE